MFLGVDSIVGASVVWFQRRTVGISTLLGKDPLFCTLDSCETFQVLLPIRKPPYRLDDPDILPPSTLNRGGAW